jgi:hypothetical protein
MVAALGRSAAAPPPVVNDHGHAPADNILGQCYKSIGLTIRGAEINLHVPAFDVSGVFFSAWRNAVIR